MKHSIQTHRVPRETSAKVNTLVDKNSAVFESYIDQLLWWNKRINLVSRDVSRGTILMHIYHSLLISQFKEFLEAEFIIDAGSGGGLPGLPLACCFSQKTFIINDIVSKKVLATKQIARKLKLDNVLFDDGSIENITAKEPFLLVSKHAFKINELYEMTKGKPWSQIILYKGLPYKNELDSIEEPLTIQEYALSDIQGGNFYEGKALLVIKAARK